MLDNLYTVGFWIYVLSFIVFMILSIKAIQISLNGLVSEYQEQENKPLRRGKVEVILDKFGWLLYLSLATLSVLILLQLFGGEDSSKINNLGDRNDISAFEDGNDIYPIEEDAIPNIRDYKIKTKSFVDSVFEGRQIFFESKLPDLVGSNELKHIKDTLYANYLDSIWMKLDSHQKDSIKIGYFRFNMAVSSFVELDNINSNGRFDTILVAVDKYAEKYFLELCNIYVSCFAAHSTLYTKENVEVADAAGMLSGYLEHYTDSLENGVKKFSSIGDTLEKKGEYKSVETKLQLRLQDLKSFRKKFDGLIDELILDTTFDNLARSRLVRWLKIIFLGIIFMALSFLVFKQKFKR